MKYVAYFFISLVIFLFQSAFGRYIDIAGIVPNIMLVFTVCAAYTGNSSKGFALGVLMGLFHDCFFGYYIGCNVFLYAMAGYTVGVLSQALYKDNIATSTLFVAAATLFYNFGFFVLNILLKGYTDFAGYIYMRILPETVYNSIISLPIFFMAKALERKFETGPKREL